MKYQYVANRKWLFAVDDFSVVETEMLVDASQAQTDSDNHGSEDHQYRAGEYDYGCCAYSQRMIVKLLNIIHIPSITGSATRVTPG